jgi:hypothetical protein
MTKNKAMMGNESNSANVGVRLHFEQGCAFTALTV